MERQSPRLSLFEFVVGGRSGFIDIKNQALAYSGCHPTLFHSEILAFCVGSREDIDL